MNSTNAESTPDLIHFEFRGVHPQVFMGTASDRYAGWLGQIYSGERYKDRVVRRTKQVGNRSFVEEVLPVDSVAEYFQHFRTLELDFTFYRPLLDNEGKPTATYHALRAYTRHLNREDRLILKVPQVFFARKLRRRGGFVDNPAYLDSEGFTRQFYEPALGVVAPWLEAFIFEQEYQRKKDRTGPRETASELDRFFQAVPRDARYHVELRTDALLAPPLFDLFQNRGIGQVLSHWTWLPPLERQFAASGRNFFNSGGRCLLRLMTPRGMRYEEAYARFHPFTTLVDGTIDQRMVEDTVSLMHTAVGRGMHIHVIVNNRAGGNAPLIAREIAEKFLARRPQP